VELSRFCVHLQERDKKKFRMNQCSGSVTFWYGSGSSDQYLRLTDPDPALFVSGLQDANKKLLLIEVHYANKKVLFIEGNYICIILHR
jgi:hypothetical protein